MEVMERLRKHTTIFYSTHILDDVQRVSDTVVILNKGALVAQGPIEEILAWGRAVSFTLTVKGDSAGVEARLRSQPWVTGLQEMSRNGRVSWQIGVSDRDLAEAQLAPLALAGGGVTICELGCKTRNLEDVFLSVVAAGARGVARRRRTMSANAAAEAGVLIPRREAGGGWAWRTCWARNAAWWRTRRWWTQCLVAMFFLNFLMALNLLGAGSVNNAVTTFLMVEGVVAAIAAIIMGQDAIQVERASGTAAWVLSKPLRRPAFILAKLITYAVGFLVTWFILPGAVAYLELAVIARTYLPVTASSGCWDWPICHCSST